MQRINSSENASSSSLVLPPPCLRKKTSSSLSAPARCNNNNSSSAQSIQSSSDASSFLMSSSWSPFSTAATGPGTSATTAGSTTIRSLSPLSSISEIKFPLSQQRRSDITRETRISSSQGSIFSDREGGGRRCHSTVDSLDSSILTPTMKPAVGTGLGYGCSRFLSRLPPHPETLEFIPEEGEDNGNSNHMELFRQDSWWKKGDDKIKHVWTQELKQMEEKMKELLREVPPPSSTASKDLTGKNSWKRPLTKLRIGNKKKQMTKSIAVGAKEVKMQLLQQIYDRLQAYNVTGLEASGIPLEITQFNTTNVDLPCSPNANSSSKKTPGHAVTRSKSCDDIQSPLLLDIDQTLEDNDVIATKRQRGDRVRSIQMALFRPRSSTTESPHEPQHREDVKSPIKIGDSSSPPSSPFSYWQEDIRSTASTPVCGNHQLSHQDQQRHAVEEEVVEDRDNNHNIPLAPPPSSIRQAANAIVEGIIGWTAWATNQEKKNNGPFDSQRDDSVAAVAVVEPDGNATFDSSKDKVPLSTTALDPIIHIPPPLPVQSGGGGGGDDDRGDHAENGGTFSRTIGHEKFNAQQNRKRSSPFQPFKSRSLSATRSVAHKEAGRANSPNREVACISTSSDGDASPFHFSRLKAKASVSSREGLHKDAVEGPKAAKEDGQRSSSPALDFKTILKPTASSNTISTAKNDSVESTMKSAYTCPLSLDAETDDVQNDEKSLEKTLVSFGKDPSPLSQRDRRKKVRFMRRTAEKVIPREGVDSESVASIGKMVDTCMVMTGCPNPEEAEFEDYSIISSDEDSTDGQGSGSIRTDGSLNDSLTFESGVATMIQRSQSPVQMIGEAFRAIVETPSKLERTGSGLEAPLESKKLSSSAAGVRAVRILPSRLMRKVLGRNLAKRPATPPSQSVEPKDNSFEDGPVIRKEISGMDEGVYTLTLFAPARASPIIQGERDLPSAPPEAPGRQSSAVGFMKQVLRRSLFQLDPVILRDDSKEFEEEREWKSAVNQNGGDSNDRGLLAVVSTSSTLPTKAEQSVPPFQEKQEEVSKFAKRKRRQKRYPENIVVDFKPQHTDNSGMQGCPCMCNAFGNTPSNRVPDQVVCDSKYLSREELLTKKGRCSSDISENHFDYYERHQTDDGLPEMSNGIPFLLGKRGSFRKAIHLPKPDDDGSLSDDSVNQMVVEWLVDSLKFKKSTSLVDTSLLDLFRCSSPPISSSTEDWLNTFSFCKKVDSHSNEKWRELLPEQYDVNTPMMRWTTEPSIHCQPDYSRRDGRIGEISPDYSEVMGKRAKSRRQKIRRTRKRQIVS